MDQDFDLLGDPIPEGHGQRGRPPHVATDEKRRLIIMLLAFDWTFDKIAAALNCSIPTMRKNYFRELQSKCEARARVDAKLLNALMKEADAGNVSAIDKFMKRLDKHDLIDLAEKARNPEGKSAPKKGKKEQQLDAAGQVSGKYAPPAPPGRLVN